MTRALLRRTFAANGSRLIAIALGLLAMSILMPVIFNAFGRELGEFVETVPLLRQLSEFGGTDFFTLTGAIATGFVHPFVLLLMGIMAVGFPALAIAGERASGTLEVTLARPISRRALVATLFGAGLLFLGVLLAVYLIATVVTVNVIGLGDELDLGRAVELWLGALLFYTTFMALTFWISSESDRAGPAVGIPAVIILVNYLVFVVGTIWPDAAFLEDWSLFALLRAQDILQDGLVVSESLVMLGLTVVLMGLTLVRFPGRDLPAPS